MENYNFPNNAHRFYNKYQRVSVFNMLPKINKLNNPDRPIVSVVSYPTSQIAFFLDNIFTPINQNLPTFVKDSSHTLRLLKDF